jgi:pantoate--beta-alanine ligase
MTIISAASAWKEAMAEVRRSGKTIGFVPTMGALHEGHMSLTERSKKEQDILAVSIFVNPTQFNDPHDLRSYPNRMDEDIERLNGVGTDYLFLPSYEELYPDGFCYRVEENMLSRTLCGKGRPGHFTGVMTVVLKLLILTGATAAYFGKKDWQQYKLIKGMTEAFFLETRIIPCRIIREESGLALSSRNELLSGEERIRAAELYRVLSKYAQAGKADETENIGQELAVAGFEVEYVQQHEDRLLAAVKLGKVRLIVNVKV